MKLRFRKDVKRRSKYEVFSTKEGGSGGASWHRTILAARLAKEKMKRKGKQGVIIYNIKKDSVHK